VKSYRQTAIEFTTWLQQNHPESRDLMHIPRQQAIEYLQHRQQEGKSAWTVSKDMSALNKVCGFDITKQEADLRERSRDDIKRSRVERESDERYNPANYEEQITFARAFGCRRESVLGGAYQVKSVSLFRFDGMLYVGLIEKGGRYREAPCLQSMQPQVERMFPGIQERRHLTEHEFKALYAASPEPHLFHEYTTKIDNHAFRAEYAMRLYTELATTQGESKLPQDQYRGYDENILRRVSEALGHNRPDIVVDSYMR